MHTSKTSIQILANILRQNDLDRVVFSPGSRNAPLVIELCNSDFFDTISLPDERCAAFFAMGQAQWTRKPSIICCTSGTASLNYAPAIAEAYYQGIPLLVLTADRPQEWIDHGEGQSIRQQDIYHNYIKGSYQLPQNVSNDQQQWYCNRLINEAINLANEGKKGPVHINIPFSEPLYETCSDITINTRKIDRISKQNSIGTDDLKELNSKWKSSQKRMILCGLLPPTDGLNSILSNMAANGNTAIVIENTSNLQDRAFNPCIDRSLTLIKNDQIDEFVPDVLISIGGAIVSKRLKALFREHPPKEHWHIGNSVNAQDMFQCLTKDIQASPSHVLSELSNENQELNSGFGHKWLGLFHQSAIKHQEYLEQVSFSDLKAYEIVLDSIPEGSHIHMSNSTGVRYVQLFNTIQGAKYFCNRGTSGIDGSTSTALGSTYVCGKNTVLLTGDLSFFYDSNAFWNTPVKENFKVIIFNNSGGNIFRIINGPSETDQLESFFETRHNLNAKPVAELYGLKYSAAHDQNELEEKLFEFFSSENTTCEILEIFTDSELSPKALKSYFDYLKY